MPYVASDGVHANVTAMADGLYRLRPHNADHAHQIAWQGVDEERRDKRAFGKDTRRLGNQIWQIADMARASIIAF
ncbi:MAG TPA: hypothetical protein VF797_15970 [Noviherbaspirillum sp.]